MSFIKGCVDNQRLSVHNKYYGVMREIANIGTRRMVLEHRSSVLEVRRNSVVLRHVMS